jgi:HEAT repeat protein
LQNSESHLRTIAAWALGEVGDVKAIEPLSQLIEDKDDSVSEAVKEALSKLRNINDR